MRKHRLLDLYCKAGGAAKGYANAGFEVWGVDIEPQPNYPFQFIKADAIRLLQEGSIDGWDIVKTFDVIHASPPCQHYTKVQSLAVSRNGSYREHPDLVEPTRKLLIESGKPYIIENVAGAPLINPIKLFGSQFKNLYTQRERWFESNIHLEEPETERTKMKTPSAGNGIGEDGSISICGSGGVRGLNAAQIRLYWGFALGGIDWMTRAEMAEAIPPAYTEFIGKQIRRYLDEYRSSRRTI